MRSWPLSATACLAVLVTVGIVVASMMWVPWTHTATRAATAWAETERISDGATATAPDQVRVGGTIQIRGTGWKTLSGAGSVIAVKLDEGEVRPTAPVANPLTGEVLTDSSIFTALRADSDGKFSVKVRVPVNRDWVPGTRHSVRLVTGRIFSDDATRSVALSFDLVAAQGSRSALPKPSISASPSASASPTAAATPTASPRATERSHVRRGRSSASSITPTRTSPPLASKPTPTQSPAASPQVAKTVAPSSGNKITVSGGAPAPVQSASPSGPAAPRSTPSRCPQKALAVVSSPTRTRGVPTVEPGGSLLLVGTGFCQPGGGGSRVAVQIDDGSLRRLDQSVHPDRAVWRVVDADAQGRFRASIRIPDSDETQPRLSEGMHRLRLVTGSLRSSDAVRSVLTAEFVVGVGNHSGVLPEPTSPPLPVDSVTALVGAKGGAVTIDRSGSTVRLVVPELEPGDWVFPYAFGGKEADQLPAQPARWVQLDADRSVAIDLGDLRRGDNGPTRVSVQARDGTLAGWAPMPEDGATTGTASVPPAASAAGEVDDSGDVGSEPGRRPLVLVGGVVVLLIGVAWTVAARQRRLRRIQELNRR